MYEDIAKEEIVNTLKCLLKWKSLGIDEIKKKLLAPPSILHISTNDETYFRNH